MTPSPPRVAVGGLMHESNAFRPDTTPLDAFIRVPPDAVEAVFADTTMELTGFLHACARDGAEIAPLPFAWADSSGLVDHHAADTLVAEIVDTARATAPDAVMLCLHGSMTAEHDDDVEGTLLSALRAELGDEVIIGATLDWHASITPAMRGAADVLCSYRTYPHVDQLETASRLAELVLAATRGEYRPVSATVRLPAVIAGPATSHHHEPMAGVLIEATAAMGAVEGLLDWSICPGFARSDTPHVGVHVHAVADGNEDVAAAAARSLGELVWAARHSFVPDLTSIDAAMDAARNPPATTGPLVLADQGDNPGGGAPGNGTTLLRALLEADPADAVVALCDPTAAEAAHAAGLGATVELTIGAADDTPEGRRVDVVATVEHLGDGRYTMRSPTHDGIPRDVGPTATLRIGGVRVVATSAPAQHEDLEMFGACGVDVTTTGVVTVKSNAHFRAAFEPIAAAILDVDTPGISTPHLARLPYRRITRPVFPIDADAAWPPSR